MLTFIDALFIGSEAIFLAYTINKYRPHIFITLHVLIFWVFILIFNGVRTYLMNPDYSVDVYFIVHTLVMFYLLTMILIGVKYKNRSNNLIEEISRIPYSSIVSSISAWLIFHIYIIRAYGLAGLNLYSYRIEIGAPYWVLMVNSYLWYFAFGGFLVFIIRMSVKPLSVLKPLAILSASAFFLFAVIFNEVQSARRFLLMIGVLFVLIAFYRYGRRAFLYRLAVLIPLIFVGEYWQLIRKNISNPEFIYAVEDKEYSSAMLIYLDPTRGIETRSTIEGLSDRLSPFSILYSVSAQQLEDGTLTYGKILSRSLLNVVPALLVSNKETINADQQLAQAFKALPDDDIASGLLVVVQADFGPLAYGLVPLLISFLILAYAGRITHHKYSGLKILFLALAIGTAQIIEELPDALLVNIRDMLAIITIIYSFKIATTTIKDYLVYKNSQRINSK